MNEELQQRKEGFRRAMREHGIDAAVVAPGPNLYYLAGYWGNISRRFTALILGAHGDDQEVFVCPGFEESLHAQNLSGVDSIRSWPRAGDEWAGALGAFGDWGFGASGRIAIDPDLPWSQTEPMLKKAATLDYVSMQGAIADVRMVKSPAEIAKMREATIAAAKTIAEVNRNLADGVMEDALEAQFLRDADDGTGTTDTWIMMLFGPSAAEPHGVTVRRELAPGDVVLHDFGTTRDRYHSDTTRTIFHGEVEDEAKKVWEIVHRAYHASREAARPGATFTAIDAAARKVITDAGYGDRFTHGVGHGIGLGIHELPYPEPGRDTKMRPGMTITIEPGIYFPGRFGVRLEDTMVITEDGCVPIDSDPPMQTQL